MKNKPQALYIHIPFCKNICDYCDFTKLLYGSFSTKEYLKALKNEILSYNIRNVDTIFVGGGTPTCLEINELKELLETIKPYSKTVKEYTVESNPETLNKEKLLLLKEYGVNRLSIGVESTNDAILRSINRKHSFSDVVNTINLAKEVGINNINVDLILGLPNVTEKLFLSDLSNVLKLPINHISIYSLTVHEHTVFYLNGISEPEEEFTRALYDKANKILKENGFIHYEVSNWAKPGFESKHNMQYWENKQYYGIGLGASGYIGDTRYTNTRNISSYLKGLYIGEREIVNKDDELLYYIMLSLRTNRGLDLEFVNSEYNYDILKLYKDYIEECLKEKLLIIKDNHLIPTHEGMMILDQIILNFYPNK